MLVKNDLFDYEDRFIYQDSEYFKFSLDSILLAEYASEDKGHNILDMCAGNMAVSLILSKYINANITGFELMPEVFELGQKSIILNKLEDNLKIINDDVKNIGDYYSAEYFDAIVCNPPFFKTNENININKVKEKAVARHELSLTMEDIFKISRTYLKNKGNLYIVHRAERLDELITLASKYQINIKNIQLISTKKGENPRIVLVKAVKNSKQGVKINKEICIENLKTYKNIFKEGI